MRGLRQAAVVARLWNVIARNFTHRQDHRRVEVGSITCMRQIRQTPM